jgi:hypothetical protein
MHLRLFLMCLVVVATAFFAAAPAQAHSAALSDRELRLLGEISACMLAKTGKEVRDALSKVAVDSTRQGAESAVEQVVMTADSAKAGMNSANLEILRKVRLLMVRDALLAGATFSGAFSAVFNIKLLLSAEFLAYLKAVGFDATMGAACAGVGVGLDMTGLQALGPWASAVVLFGVDMFIMLYARRIDWSRLGKNATRNIAGTGGAFLGFKLGMFLGAFMGPFAIVPGLALSLLGSFATGYVLDKKTPIGLPTRLEEAELLKDLAAKINPHLNDLGFELDTSKPLKELQSLLSDGKFPVRTLPGFDGVNTLITEAQLLGVLGGRTGLESVIRLAEFVHASFVDGLEELKRTLCK